MSQLSRVELSNEDLVSYLKKELPGIEFTSSSDNSNFKIELAFLRRVESYRIQLDHAALIDGSEAMEYELKQAIDTLRARAIEAYGLQQVMEQYTNAARKEGWNLMLKNIESYVNIQMVEWAVALDGDGHEVPLKPMPNAEGRKLLAWINLLPVQ